MEQNPEITARSGCTDQGVTALPQLRLLDGPIDPHYLRVTRLSLLWDHRNSLAKACIAGAALASLIAFLSPAKFTSTTRLMPPESLAIEQLSILSSLAEMTGLNLDSETGMITNPGDILASILTSRAVQNGVIEKLELRKVYDKSTAEDTRKELSRRTRISVSRRNPVISLEVTDHDPRRAQAIAEEYVARLNLVSAQMDTSASHRERVFLEERLAQTATDLESAENELSRFATGNSLIDIEEQGKTSVRTHLRLEGELIAEKTQLEGLRRFYGDGNVRVHAEEARIAELNRQMEVLGRSSDASDTRSLGQNGFASSRKLPRLQVQYSDLFRRVRVEEAVFEALSEKHELAKVQEAKDLPSVKVLDPPDVPEKKEFPLRLLMIAVGLFIGLLSGVVWTFVHADWDHLDPQDPAKLLATRVYVPMASRVEPRVRAIAGAGRAFETILGPLSHRK